MDKNLHNIVRLLSALLVVILGCSLPLSLAAAVQAQLDRSRIVEGETVTLTILTDDARQSLDADFSAIEKNFVILDRRSETQLSIVNGQQTAVVRLLLTLEPRQAGMFNIPSIVFGSDSTVPISVTVDKAPELEPGALPPVFIEVEVTPAEGPYFVHAQFGLVVRVFYQQNLTEAAISQPEPAPASVKLLQETPYQAERGGERYRVLERNYAIFPERSGELTIPAMQLSGRLVERRTSGVWQPTVRGRRVTVESEPLKLDIQPRPPEFSGSEWQPARQLKLTQQVSSADALRVGEPVTRTVMIDAVGLEENMIAEPVWPELPGARIYPDQPQGITRDDGIWVLGHKEFRYAVVPEKEGELILPELSVTWWDTKNNRQQEAVLPSHKLYVQPAVLVPAEPPAAAVVAANNAIAASQTRSGVTAPSYWRWLAIVFAALWIITLLFAWKWRRGNPAAESVAKTQQAARDIESVMLGKLRKACERDDRNATRRLLQSWLSEYGPTSGKSILEFADGLDDSALRECIHALDSDGFRPATSADRVTSWSGRSFWNEFDRWNRARQASDQSGGAPLTDLYAQENRSGR